MISLAELVFGESGSGDYANIRGGAWGFGSTAQLAQPEEWIGLRDREVADGRSEDEPQREGFFEGLLAGGTDPTRSNYRDYHGMKPDVLVRPTDHIPPEVLPGKDQKISWDDLVVTRDDPAPNGADGTSTEYLVTTNGAGLRG